MPNYSQALMSQYLRDPRMMLSQQAMQTGSDTSPVKTPMEGLARALTGALGGYQQGKLRGEYDDLQKQRNESLAKALTAFGAGDEETGASLLGNNPELSEAYLKAKLKSQYSDDPSSVKTFEYYQGLDDDRKDTFMNLLRAPTTMNLGGTYGVLSPSGDGVTHHRKTLQPDKQPGYLVVAEGAKTAGRNQAEKAAVAPKAQASLETARANSQRTIAEIDKAISETSHWTAGLGGAALKNVPMTDARDLKATLDTIRANIGFDRLQEMRDNSPTGGALGQVSEREIAFLQSVLGNLEQSQSPGQLRENLQNAKAAIQGSFQRIQAAYEQDYGSSLAPAQQPQTDLQGAAIEELRRRGAR